MSDRRSGIFIRNGHFLSVIGISAYRSVYYPLGLAQLAVNHRRIFAGQAVFFNLMRKRGVRHIVFRNQQQSACILIYPVNYAGAQNPVDSRKAAAAVIQQRVDKRSAPVSRRGVNHHALGLVDNEHTVVLIPYIERNIFRLRRIVLSGFNIDSHLIVDLRLEALADNLSIDRYTAVFRHMLNTGTRELRESIRYRAVNTLIRRFGIDRKAQRITSGQGLRHFSHLRRLRLSCRRPTDISCFLLSSHIPFSL